jgi:TRAP-type C4-dicarboxylate transport system permease small subunit
LLGLILAVTQLVLRNVAQVGLPWIDHLLRHLVLYVALFGAVVACRPGRHIRLDVVGALAPAASAHLGRLFDCIAAVVCALLAVAAARFWLVEWSSAPPGMRWIAVLPVILPVGFALIALAFLLRAMAPPPHSESAE